MIETTVNVPMGMPERLSAVAGRYGIRTGPLICAILRRAFRRQRRFAGVAARIRYQSPGRDWIQMHIRIPDGLYGACLDMRSVGRVSISRCFVCEVEGYLDETLRDLFGEKDDNTHLSYSLFYQRNGDSYTIIVTCAAKATRLCPNDRKSPP